MSLADEAILIEEHNARLQADRLILSSAQISDDSQVQPSTAQPQNGQHGNQLTLSSPPTLQQQVQDVIVLSSIGQNHRQNASCPLPCFMKSTCQACIESQCM